MATKEQEIQAEVPSMRIWKLMMPRKLMKTMMSLTTCLESNQDKFFVQFVQKMGEFSEILSKLLTKQTFP